jgi:hypothetical protein
MSGDFVTSAWLRQRTACLKDSFAIQRQSPAVPVSVATSGHHMSRITSWSVQSNVLIELAQRPNAPRI